VSRAAREVLRFIEGKHSPIADNEGLVRLPAIRFRRARVVSEPLADYIRFEHAITSEVNVSAGEEVRWLPRQSAAGLLVPLCDFWVFDSLLVRFGYFAGDGTFLEHELSDDPEVVRSCADAFESVWDRAIPHDDYRPS
jgi:hypothetical protein